MTMQGMKFTKASGKNASALTSDIAAPTLVGSGKKKTDQYPKGRTGSKPGPRKQVNR